MNADLQVTVLIDTYNSGHLIHRAIESVLAQTYPASSMELLIVDDGSTDDTAEVVQRYANRVRYIVKQNGGQASALNEGFRQARGEIICLLDGDDYFYPEKVERVAAAFEGNAKASLVYNKVDIVDLAGVTIEAAFPHGAWRGNLGDRTLLGYPWSCPTSGMSVRQNAVSSIHVPEDVFLTSPDVFLGSILPLVGEVELIDTPLSAWVMHGRNQYVVNPHGPYPGFRERAGACIAGYAESRLGKRFVTYMERGMYAPTAEDRPRSRGRLLTYLRECSQILQARVEPGLKARAQIKLAAGLLLPNRTRSRLTSDRG